MDATGIEEPSGLIACDPELYKEIMSMTTKVKVELVQSHIPVEVKVAGQVKAILFENGESYEDYVHSTQNITVCEITPPINPDQG